MALHADASAADGLQLFNDIAVNEKALISAIENVRANFSFFHCSDQTFRSPLLRRTYRWYY